MSPRAASPACLARGGNRRSSALKSRPGIGPNAGRAQAQQLRFAEQGELKRQFDAWAQATRAAITAGYETEQRLLPGMESPLPPTVRRRLKEHQKEVDDYTFFLERRLQFTPPNVELLGVLLRVPAKEVG